MAFDPTPEQHKLLKHDHLQHARVLAGPGTGKSSTVVAYMERLLASDPAPRLRLLTFTRSATSELAEKMAAVAGGKEIRPSTIHSFAISVLLANGGLGSFPEPLRIADEWENENIVLPSLMRQMGCGKKVIRKYIQEMASAWESLDAGADTPFTPAQRARFLGIWNEHRTVLGYTLLQELPYRLHEALVNEVDLERCAFDLLIVDEYQDLNACDLAVIRLLAEQYGCQVLGIGDDDQSIYSFRSAAPEGIRRFQEDYPGSFDYPLTVTLRCGRRIIEWANHVIRQNTDRPADRADLCPGENNPDGEVALYSFQNDASEAKGVAALVHKMMTDGKFEASEILVLLRGDHNQTFSKPIKKALDTLGITYADTSWVDVLLETTSHRMFLALLRLAAVANDSLAWATVLCLTKGVGDAFFDQVYEHAKSKQCTFADALLALASSEFAGLSATSARRAKATIDAASAWIENVNVPEEMPEGGWTAWLRELPPLPVGNAPTAELFDLMGSVELLIDDDIDLGRFLNQLAPLGKDIANTRADGVRIMSLASSKGLTVKGTIIAACEDGVIPREGQDRSEEARLMYVGMTRAREVLYCTWARRRSGPTARAGRASVRKPRRPCGFFDSGPVKSQRGDDLLK